jgi:hypothetical protein
MWWGPHLVEVPCEAGRRIVHRAYPEWTVPCPRPGTATTRVLGGVELTLQLCRAHRKLLRPLLARSR